MKTFMYFALAAVAVAVAGLGACAAPDAVTSAESPTEREYPTGSNIPRKNRNPQAEGIRVHTREDLERTQQGGHGASDAGRPR